jgi:glutathione S-transferase
MILVGRYLSPFVRRVGATLHLYGMPFEHRAMLAFGDDKARLREWNPVARVPTLLLDDGEAVVDSSAIIDYLDEQVGPERALTPPSGAERRRVLKLVAVALGAAEKAVLTVYEQRFRPEEIRHAPWVEMCAGQARDGFRWLDAQLVGDHLAGERMTQADVTTVAAYEFVRAANTVLFASLECPRLEGLSARLGELEAFRLTLPS